MEWGFAFGPRGEAKSRENRTRGEDRHRERKPGQGRNEIKSWQEIESGALGEGAPERRVSTAKVRSWK